MKTPLRSWIRSLPIHIHEPAASDFSHRYPPDDQFPESFFEQLEKTVAWTEGIILDWDPDVQMDYAHVLRTPSLEYNDAPFYHFATGTFAVEPPDIPFNYQAVLNGVLPFREVMAFDCKASELGRVLEFQIDISTRDGAPEVQSEGFVDGSDIPPIDTWFYVTKTYLYCWIPRLFISKTQEAMDVEILDSYRWIKDSRPELQQRIEARFGHNG